jgi:hypothetical protein
MKLFVVILLDRGDLFAYPGKLADLVFYLVLKQAHLVLEIFDAQLVQHDNIVISVVSQEALEANGAQVILAECLDFL